MALPDPTVVPPQDQQRRLNEFLTELAQVVPPGIKLDPSWEPASQAWTVWVINGDSARSGVYGRFVKASLDLAERHGVEMDLIPIEVRSWG